MAYRAAYIPSRTKVYIMQLLELFAGSRSIGKAAEAAGYDVVSTDLTAYEGIDIVVDILELDYKSLDIKPTVIWASPPCTSFSIAACSSHWRLINGMYVPISEGAMLGMQLINKTLEIIEYFKPKYWYIENPRGLLRKMPVMKKYERTTVWYCTYGDMRAKPTDVWSNNLYSLFKTNGWASRPQCYNGNTHCHHEPAPRGSKTGTQGLKNNHERSKIPTALCNEIILSTI